MTCDRCNVLLGLILIILIAWGVYIIEYWGNWDAVSAFVTIFAAIGAVVAAGFAAWSALILRKQHERDINWRKRERTFSYSLTNRTKIADVTNDLKGTVTHMDLTQSQLKILLKDKTKTKAIVKQKNSEDFKLLANHYGVLAMEYYADTIDRPLIKNLSWLQFMRFGFSFRKNLEGNDIYENYNKLYNEWKANPPD